MKKYTWKTMKDIGKFYDINSEDLRRLLTEYGRVLDGGGASVYTLNLIYRNHEAAYIKRKKNGKPHPVSILENEIDTEKNGVNYRILCPWQFCRN